MSSDSESSDCTTELVSRLLTAATEDGEDDSIDGDNIEEGEDDNIEGEEDSADIDVDEEHDYRPAPVSSARALRNKHTFPLPDLKDGESWALPTMNQVYLTRDHSSASEKGVQAAFPDSQVISADCTFHAGPSHYSKTHSGLLNSRKKDVQIRQVGLMSSDFGVLINCPHIAMVPVVKEEMVAFWMAKKGRNEKRFAEAWAKTYFSSNLSRVILSEHYGLRGGKPGDNNQLERSNREDKAKRKYMKTPPIKFMNHTAKHLEQESRAQKDFYGNLKPPIHCSRFMEHVRFTCVAQDQGNPCMLTVQFPFRCIARGVPAGSLIVPKHRTIKKLEERERLAGSPNLTIPKCKQLLKRRSTSRLSTLDDYRSLVKDPVDWMKQRKELLDYKPHMGFDHIRKLTSIFCCLRPIDVSSHRNAVSTLCEILSSNGYGVIPVESIAAKKSKGLVSCDCTNYLHYAWCYHACSIAMSRGIITSYPKNMDPRPCFAGKKRGRPAMARKGGALGTV